MCNRIWLLRCIMCVMACATPGQSANSIASGEDLRIGLLHQRKWHTSFITSNLFQLANRIRPVVPCAKARIKFQQNRAKPSVTTCLDNSAKAAIDPIPASQTSTTTSEAISPKASIMISGGGPAGLIAAVLFRRRGIDVTVVEREQNLTVWTPRSHFMTISKRGQDVLERRGLLNRFLQAVPARDKFVIHSMKNSTFRFADLSPPNIRLSRPFLQQILLSAMMEEEEDAHNVGGRLGTLRFIDGVHVTNLEPIDDAPDGRLGAAEDSLEERTIGQSTQHALTTLPPLQPPRLKVVLSDGSVHYPSHIVAADGKWSSVRILAERIEAQRAAEVAASAAEKGNELSRTEAAGNAPSAAGSDTHGGGSEADPEAAGRQREPAAAASERTHRLMTRMQTEDSWGIRVELDALPEGWDARFVHFMWPKTLEDGTFLMLTTGDTDLHPPAAADGDRPAGAVGGGGGGRTATVGFLNVFLPILERFPELAPPPPPTGGKGGVPGAAAEAKSPAAGLEVWLGAVRRLLEEEFPPIATVLPTEAAGLARHLSPAVLRHQWVDLRGEYDALDGRVALVGDAAHCMPNMSGQGLNTVIESAEALDAALGPPPPPPAPKTATGPVVANRQPPPGVEEITRAFREYGNRRPHEVRPWLDMSVKASRPKSPVTSPSAHRHGR